MPGAKPSNAALTLIILSHHHRSHRRKVTLDYYTKKNKLLGSGWIPQKLQFSYQLAKQHDFHHKILSIIPIQDLRGDMQGTKWYSDIQTSPHALWNIHNLLIVNKRCNANHSLFLRVTVTDRSSHSDLGVPTVECVASCTRAMHTLPHIISPLHRLQARLLSHEWQVEEGQESFHWKR